MFSLSNPFNALEVGEHDLKLPDFAPKVGGLIQYTGILGCGMWDSKDALAFL